MTTTSTARVLDDRRNAKRRRHTEPARRDIIPDGGRVTVSMLTLDSADDVQRAVATTRLTDAEAAYESQGVLVRNAWRNPTPWVTDAKPADQQRERQPRTSTRPQRTNDAKAAWEAEGDRVREAWKMGRRS
jgi:hypothetical protein